jgi:hypothetical protein
MISGKEKLIPVLAITVLVIGIISTIYVNANENDQRPAGAFITINGNNYSFNELNDIFQNITIETDDGKKIGIPLEEIIPYSGVNCPSCNIYTFKASDPYQQTIIWRDVRTGVLTYDEEYNLRVYFPDLAHTFWVFNLIEIEVNNL